MVAGTLILRLVENAAWPRWRGSIADGAQFQGGADLTVCNAPVSSIAAVQRLAGRDVTAIAESECHGAKQKLGLVESKCQMGQGKKSERLRNSRNYNALSARERRHHDRRLNHGRRGE